MEHDGEVKILNATSSADFSDDLWRYNSFMEPSLWMRDMKKILSVDHKNSPRTGYQDIGTLDDILRNLESEFCG